MTRRINFGTGGSGWQKRHRIARNVNAAVAATHRADIGGLRVGAEDFLGIDTSFEILEVDDIIALRNFRARAHVWLTKAA